MCLKQGPSTFSHLFRQACPLLIQGVDFSSGVEKSSRTMAPRGLAFALPAAAGLVAASS